MQENSNSDLGFEGTAFFYFLALTFFLNLSINLFFSFCGFVWSARVFDRISSGKNIPKNA